MTPILLVHISSSWVKISLYTEFQLPRLPGSRTASFRLNPMGGSGDPNFFLDISSSWVEISLHAKFQLPSMSGSGSFMVGDKNKKLCRIRGYLSPG